MPKIGRNDPCHCGSGKKYKQCHLPIEEAAQAAQRQLDAAQDRLTERIVEAAQAEPQAMPAALTRFWGGKYTPEQLSELDELEQRGAERFLTWFAFDYVLDDGRTLVERLAAEPSDLELSGPEAQLLPTWTATRLRPYAVEAALKGQQMDVRDLLDGAAYTVFDHAASRFVEPGEVLIAHLVPVGEHHRVGGAAAHLTADTREKLHEFALLHLEAFAREHPGATWVDLLRTRSEVLNHFVMALPVEEPDPAALDRILEQTRLALDLTGAAPLEEVDEPASGAGAPTSAEG